MVLIVREQTWSRALTLAAFCIAAGVSGCSVLPVESDERGASGLSMEEAQSQYKERTSELPLPEGALWPELPSEGPNGEPLEYDQWAPTVQAESYWRCSWQGAWLEAQGNENDRADDALAKLSTFTEMRTYTSLYDDASRDQFDDQMERAALGDAAPTRQDTDVNCDDG